MQKDKDFWQETFQKLKIHSFCNYWNLEVAQHTFFIHNEANTINESYLHFNNNNERNTLKMYMDWIITGFL